MAGAAGLAVTWGRGAEGPGVADRRLGKMGRAWETGAEGSPGRPLFSLGGRAGRAGLDA